MPPDLCPKCGLNFGLVGRFTHHCVPRVSHVANDMANNGTSCMANKISATYRYRDKEKRQRYQRELMRRRRAAFR